MTSPAPAGQGDRDDLVAYGLREYLRMSLVQEVLVPAPAAAADWLFKVPAGEIWELYSVSMLLTTSAAVANRNSSLRLSDANDVQLARCPSAGVVTAGLTSALTYLAGYGFSNSNNGLTTGLSDPPFVLAPSWRIGTATSNLDVADQFSAIVICARIWSPSLIAQYADQIDSRYRLQLQTP